MSHKQLIEKCRNNELTVLFWTSNDCVRVRDCFTNVESYIYIS